MNRKRGVIYICISGIERLLLLGPWIVESCLATTKIALDRPKNCSIFTFHKVWEIGVCIMRQFQVRLKLKIVAILHIGLISSKMSKCFIAFFNELFVSKNIHLRIDSLKLVASDELS